MSIEKIKFVFRVEWGMFLGMSVNLKNKVSYQVRNQVLGQVRKVK